MHPYHSALLSGSQYENSLRKYDKALLTWRRDQNAFGWSHWYLVGVTTAQPPQLNSQNV